MKELSIEEKARAYDKAIEKLHEIITMDNKPVNPKEMGEYLFPELKESEDERIRKAIYNALKYLETEQSWDFLDDNVDILDAYDWLEKQGEQKSINDLTQQEAMDIADTKFKIGDWIVYNRNDHSRKIMQIYDIRDNRYYFNDNIHFSWSVKECDEKSHLWTIKDAKDGDVLANDKSVFIYAKVLYSKPYAYCGVDKFGVFKDNCIKYDWSNSVDNIHPATKEQHDLLFQKMKEAGYKWNADKKKLIKL